MSVHAFKHIRMAGIRLLGYGSIAVCLGAAALAYTRLVLAVNDRDREMVREEIARRDPPEGGSLTARDKQDIDLLIRAAIEGLADPV